MKQFEDERDCCYKAVFGSDIYKLRRLGRCHYICDYCGKDCSMLWAFYQLSLEETKTICKPMKK